MRVLRYMSAALVGCVLQACATSANHPRELLQGRWQAVSVSENGKPSDFELTAGTSIEFDHGSFRSVVLGQMDAGTYRIHETEIDLEFSQGSISGKTRLGRFRLDGDVLYLTMPLNSEDRPAAITSAPGCRCVALQLARKRE